VIAVPPDALEVPGDEADTSDERLVVPKDSVVASDLIGTEVP
jgi:hypothetical protein